MSPEQARGRPDLTPQSDHFSLGVVPIRTWLRANSRSGAKAGPETMAAIIREEPEAFATAVQSSVALGDRTPAGEGPAERYDSTRDSIAS